MATKKSSKKTSPAKKKDSGTKRAAKKKAEGLDDEAAVLLKAFEQIQKEEVKLAKQSLGQPGRLRLRETQETLLRAYQEILEPLELRDSRRFVHILAQSTRHQLMLLDSILAASRRKKFVIS